MLWYSSSTGIDWEKQLDDGNYLFLNCIWVCIWWPKSLKGRTIVLWTYKGQLSNNIADPVRLLKDCTYIPSLEIVVLTDTGTVVTCVCHLPVSLYFIFDHAEKKIIKWGMQIRKYSDILIFNKAKFNYENKIDWRIGGRLPIGMSSPYTLWHK